MKLAKRHQTILLLTFLVSMAAGAEEPGSESWQLWNSGTAFLLPAGRREVGVFGPLRYGYSKSIELSAHPLLFFLMPNLSVKWDHASFRGIKIATQHSIYYPTLLLRTIAKDGTGGIISPEFHIPHMASWYNGVLVSTPIARSHLLTGQAGFSIAVRSGSLDERSTIDLPLVFPRLNVFYHGYDFRGGGNLRGKIFRRWHYMADALVFYLPSAEEKTAFEHKGLLLWNKSRRFQLCFGYKLSFAEYPFGTQWHLLGPLVDLQWAF